MEIFFKKVKREKYNSVPIARFGRGGLTFSLSLPMVGKLQPRMQREGSLCMTRSKSAVIVFVFLAVAVAVALSIDYTDTYVADRFRKALESGQYEAGKPFSLAKFLEYYDWDTVCVVVPGAPDPGLKNLFGLHYSPESGAGVWSLVFSRKGTVVAEIVLDDRELLPPEAQPVKCLERWATFMAIDEVMGGRRLTVVGH
jgi:hypothetical protein